MDVARLRRLAIGRSRVIVGFALAGGVVLGVDVWWVYPTLGEIYNLVPDHPIDWQFLAVFVGLPALIAVRDGGILPCWWVDIPPLLAIFLLEFTVVGAAGENGVIREFSFTTVLPAILVSVVVALLWGTLGYGLGKAVKTATSKAPAPSVNCR